MIEVAAPPRIALLGLGGAGLTTILEVWSRGKALPRLDLFYIGKPKQGIPCRTLRDYGSGMELYTAKAAAPTLSKYDILISVAGGGGRGCSLLPHIASSVRTLHIGIVYFPFSAEPAYRRRRTERAIRDFLKYANGIIVLRNDDLLHHNVPFVEVMRIYPRMVSRLVEDFHEALAGEHIQFMKDWMGNRFLTLRMAQGSPVSAARRVLTQGRFTSGLLILSDEGGVGEGDFQDVSELASSRLRYSSVAARAGEPGATAILWS